MDIKFWKPLILKSLITPLLAVLLLAYIRWQYGVLLFHTLAELFSVIVGILMMVVACSTRRFTQNDFLIYLGIGYFWIAVLDGWHTFTLKEMPFLEISDGGITLHLWIYTRLIESFLLLSALLFLKRKLNTMLMTGIFASLTLIIIWASLTLKEPVMITPDGLTAFKINAEYLIISLLSITFFTYIRFRKYLADKVLYFMLTSLVLTIFAELSFTLYTDFTGKAFVFGHLFKFLSFWMIYQAIVRTTLIEPFNVMAKNSSSYIAIPHPAVVVDSKGIISQVNRAAKEYSGLKAHQLLHKPIHKFFHPNTLSEADCELCHAIKQGKSIKNHTLLFPEKEKWFLVSLAPIKVGDRNSGMVQSLTDITERIQAKQALITNEEKFRSIFQSAMVGIILVTGKKGRISEWNTGAQHIFGYSPDEIIGQPLTILIPEQHIHSHNNGYILAIENEGIVQKGKTHEVKALRKNNEEFPIQLTLSSWKNNGKLYFSATVLDITERKKQEERILHQAHFDTLTDLPNRFLALDRLTQLIHDARRKNEKIAVLFLDLDDFKKVNDTLGHETGDKLLIEAAERLCSVARSVDTVGRLGGDEFIILLGGLNDATEARPVAENLLNRLRDAFSIDDHELMLTVSLGISMYPEDGDNVSDLLRNADSAMYHSKDLGRNTYSFYTDAMNREVSRRLALEEQIHGALERNEFTVLYQPQIEISSGRIIGTEALLRWQNPTLGTVSPTEFIPITEQTGLIVPLGQFVLKQALSQVSRWQQELDPGFRVAVNLSPRQFRDPELVNFIKATLQQTKVSGKSLELEITEGVLMSGHTHIADALTALNKMGVYIAMDDFGTGYSSLSYLRNYPFDVLKIDRSFIRDITEDPADRELVNATVAMAHSLKLKVVAEGIETEAQLTYLKQLGCDFGQGYYFEKAVDTEKIAELLKNQKL